MTPKELGVNLERRSTKTLIRWYGRLLSYKWVAEFGERPEPYSDLYGDLIEAIQFELGRRVLRDAKWGRA